MTSDHPRRRDATGRFAAPIQPRPATRFASARSDQVPLWVWEQVLARANEPVVLRIPGRRTERVTRFEATVIRLAAGSPASSRLDALIRITIRAARYVRLHDLLIDDLRFDEEGRREIVSALREDHERDFRTALLWYAKQRRLRNEDAHLFLAQKTFGADPQDPYVYPT